MNGVKREDQLGKMTSKSTWGRGGQQRLTAVEGREPPEVKKAPHKSRLQTLRLTKKRAWANPHQRNGDGKENYVSYQRASRGGGGGWGGES